MSVTPEELARRQKALRHELATREFLVPAEAAFLFGRSKATLNRWIRRGLPVYVTAGIRFVRKSEVRDFITTPEKATRVARSRLL